MKADQLRLEELIQFADGVVSLHGRRLVLHDIRAFAQFRKDLLDMVGREQGRRILTRFGLFWGQADAAAMNRIFQWDSLAEWVKAGPRMHAIQGVARNVIRELRIDEETGDFHMEVAWYDSGEAEEHLAELGPTDHPVCWMLVGYASGYASYCLGRSVYFIERQCRAKGDPQCVAVGRPAEAWGEELSPFLPYFHAEGFQTRIEQLTQELRARTQELTRERRRREALERQTPSGLIEAHSPAFQRVLELAGRVGPYDTSLLITGESGVGKEILARHVHRLSHRAHGPFVAINCGALPETLLESELFGHKAGAFTGAVDDRIGLFEHAAGGTLFLDEIAEISPALQVKLLRVLQEKEVLRLGENRPRKIDVRVIAATNRNLREAIAAGQFREDLYYRLGVIELAVPPLRNRREDVLPLARHFVQQFARRLDLPRLRLDATCLDYLQEYTWPGNVRELENAIERAAVLSRDGLILPEHLPPAILRAGAGPAAGPAEARSLAEVEAAHIRRVLSQVGGNRTRAARILGIGSATLWRKLKRLGPEPADA